MGIFSQLFRRNKNGKLEINEDVHALSTEKAEQQVAGKKDETKDMTRERHLEPDQILEKVEYFKVDFEDFWFDIRESKKRHISKPYTPETIQAVQSELGYRLPDSYKDLMKDHNGGLVSRCRVKMPEGVEERVCITGIFGIGSDMPYSLCGKYGSRFITEAYRHNSSIGVAICNTLQPGRGVIFLDYRQCGATGEPCVTYSDSVAGTETVIAKNFAQFINGLTPNIITAE